MQGFAEEIKSPARVHHPHFSKQQKEIQKKPVKFNPHFSRRLNQEVEANCEVERPKLGGAINLAPQTDAPLCLIVVWKYGNQKVAQSNSHPNVDKAKLIEKMKQNKM